MSFSDLFDGYPGGTDSRVTVVYNLRVDVYDLPGDIPSPIYKEAGFDISRYTAAAAHLSMVFSPHRGLEIQQGTVYKVYTCTCTSDIH